MEMDKIRAYYEQPLMELVYEAATVHREHFPAVDMQLSSLLSVKTGACPEDCAYCSQSGHYDTPVENQKLMSLDMVMAKARFAKKQGATRFCMAAGWRSLPKKELDTVCEMIKAVKEMGLETCVTMGMLSDEHVEALSEAGLDFYNHNLDTSPAYYEKIISTRTYQDRLDTLKRVGDAGMKVCCGGIVGMGESREDRLAFIHQLSILPYAPESIPIGMLVRIQGTPLYDAPKMDPMELVRTIATMRLVFPKVRIRLCGGRSDIPESVQVLCFMAGANSVFNSEKLLTTPNPNVDITDELLSDIGMPVAPPELASESEVV